MSDERLRELERRWKETGAMEDEAAYLQGLVRSGSISPSDVMLAAYLGHPASSVACGSEGPTIPGELDEWIRGLEWWSSDLAIWAVAEAALAVAPDEAAARQHYQRARDHAQGRLRSGGLPAPGEHDSHIYHLAHSKVLRLALGSQAADWRYLPDDDPEAVSANQRIVERFPILDAKRWCYNHVERTETGWVHVFRYLRSADRETRQQIPAAKGWAPEPGLNRACLPGRKGVLGNLILRFGDEDVARGRIRDALLPWALREVAGSEP